MNMELEPAQPVDARQCRDQNRGAACALRGLEQPVCEAECRLPVIEPRPLGTDGASMSPHLPKCEGLDETERDIAAHQPAVPVPTTRESHPYSEPDAVAHRPATPAAGRSLQYLNAGPDEPLEWVWDRVVPLRKLSLITGEPGCGKSLMVVDVIARVTRGAEEGETGSGGVMEIGEEEEEPAPLRSGLGTKGLGNNGGTVILFSYESEFRGQLKARLEEAGADMSRVLAYRDTAEIPDVDEIGTKEARRLARQDLVKLEAGVVRLRDEGHDVRMIVIDPIESFLDVFGRGAAMSRAIERLDQLALRLGVAVVAVSHTKTRKSGRQGFRSLAVGNEALSRIASSVWVLVHDLNRHNRRLLLPYKTCLTGRIPGLAFELRGMSFGKEPDGVDADEEWLDDPSAMGDEGEMGRDGEGETEGGDDESSLHHSPSPSLPLLSVPGPGFGRPSADGRFEWDQKAVLMSGQDYVAAEASRRRTPLFEEEQYEITRVTRWLKQFLSEGAMASNAIKLGAERNEISYATLRRAFAFLNCKAEKQGLGQWIWRLPLEDTRFDLFETRYDGWEKDLIAKYGLHRLVELNKVVELQVEENERKRRVAIREMNRRHGEEAGADEAERELTPEEIKLAEEQFHLDIASNMKFWLGEHAPNPKRGTPYIPPRSEVTAPAADIPVSPSSGSNSDSTDEYDSCDEPKPERPSGIGGGLLPLIFFLIALVGANWSVMVCAADLLAGSREPVLEMTDKPEAYPTTDTDGTSVPRVAAVLDLQRAKEMMILNPSCDAHEPAVPGRAYKNRKMLIVFSVFKHHKAAMITRF